MCLHCESEANTERSVELSRFVDGSSSQNGQYDRSSTISRIVEGSEDEASSHYVTASYSLKYSPPLVSSIRSGPRSPPVASSTLIDTRCHSRLRSTPVASSTFIESTCYSRLKSPPLASSTILDGRCRSSMRTPPIASSTLLDTRCRSRLKPSPLASSTLIHSSGTSEDSGCGGSLTMTHDVDTHTCKPRGHRRRSFGLFRTSTRNDLRATDDLRPGSNTSQARRKSLNGEQKRSVSSDKDSVVRKQMKKTLLKKFQSFSDSANRSELCTIALL